MALLTSVMGYNLSSLINFQPNCVLFSYLTHFYFEKAAPNSDQTGSAFVSFGPLKASVYSNEKQQQQQKTKTLNRLVHRFIVVSFSKSLNDLYLI